MKLYLLSIIIGINALLGISYNEVISQNDLKSDSINTHLFTSSSVDENINSIGNYNNIQLDGPLSSNEDFVQQIKDLGIIIQPGNSYANDSYNTSDELEACAALVFQTLNKVSNDITENLKNLTLYFNNYGRRGLGGGNTVILRCKNVSDMELVGVFIHELGHIKDTGVFKGDFWAGDSEFKDGSQIIFNNDLSLDFYRISFTNEHLLKQEASYMDFVTEYAMTDPFEDFAETFNFYLLHGNEFRYLIESSPKLKQKYNYMKIFVFNGEEFHFDKDFNFTYIDQREYDSTLLSYNLKDFLDF